MSQANEEENFVENVFVLIKMSRKDKKKLLTRFYITNSVGVNYFEGIWYAHHGPFLVKSLAEGFFCQTTTSEERDLVGKGAEKDSFLLDDSAGHYLSRSSQESEEDITRYVTTAVLSKEF